MKYNFKSCNRDQLFLLPVSMKDWLPKDHLCWFILDTMKMMDLSSLYKRYRLDGRGGAAYDPEMMLSLMLYSYCMGERSSRQIERLCQVDIAYRILSASNYPDHATIAHFRKEHASAMETLFVEVLKLCKTAGLLKVGLTALDGTKIQGNTNLASNKSHEHIAKEVKKMLEEANKIDAEEDELYGKDKNGSEWGEGFRTPEERLKRLQECKERMEKEAKAKAEEAKKKIEKREQQEQETGKKPRGKAPKAIDEAAELNTKKANVTDPESRVMKNFHGFVQGYNGQAISTEEQIIIAAELTNESNDQKQVEPMLESMEKMLTAIGEENKSETLLADAGYCSEHNLSLEEKKGIEFIFATKQDAKQRKELGQAQEMIIDEPKTLKEKMSRKLQTERGGNLYKRRGCIIEPVFGQIKTCLRFRKFSRRGLTACASEWKLVCSVHNLMKLFRHGGLKMA